MRQQEFPVTEEALASVGKTSSRPISARVPRSGVIETNQALCLTCRECEVACSLYHELECNPHLSSIQIDFDDFHPGLPDLRVCKQCDYPACYYACLARNSDPAFAIDPSTGARYIQASKCTGCGACLKACPLTPERPVLIAKRVGRKKIYLKCDLCKDRAQGPLCVQVCPAGALSYTPATTRRG